MAREQLRDECVHYTGVFSGRCKAGVSYDDVRDQNRKNEFARFPCIRSLESFTACARSQFVRIGPAERRCDVSQKNWGRTIVYLPPAGSRRRAYSGVLLGCTSDRSTAFIEKTTKGGSRLRMVESAADCSFDRRKLRGLKKKVA